MDLEEQMDWSDNTPAWAEKINQLTTENSLLKEQVAELRKNKMDSTRKYLPTLAELLDRLTINQIKEVKIPDHKDKYAQEIHDILVDIEGILSRHQIWFNARMLRALVILSQMNLHIWMNESSARSGDGGEHNLMLSHSLNSVRNHAKNIIQEVIGGRKDYKLDVILPSSEWIPSGYEQ